MTNTVELFLKRNIEEYLKEIQAAQTASALWDVAVNFFQGMGIPMGSYHHVPPPGAPDYRETYVTAEGFPDRWVQHYVDNKLFEFDPIPGFAMEHTQPYKWSQVNQLMTLSANQKAYIDELRQAELGDGVAIPVYGPGGRNGYVGIGFGNSGIDEFCMASLNEIQWICQATHLRLCTILAEFNQPMVKLSPREEEVLAWVARGKSNSDISVITGISPNTVDTYLRRIFTKLGVTDRVTAAVKGVGSGIIRAA